MHEDFITQYRSTAHDIEENRAMTTTYIVQRGDTLSEIAERFGVTLQNLIRANPQIPNPDLIHPGEVINIPARYRTYIVQPGDTLSEIAERFGVTLQNLIRANPQIRNPDLIHPGEIVYIP
ncbi:MAG: LysM peptidoglycan-binding domain-containing protein [Pseudonocardiaceae bacterium]